jgi:hypothetical protein
MSKADDRIDKTEDELFAQKAKVMFEQSVDSLDGQTRSRLNQSRQAALAELDSGTVSLVSWGRWTHWAPAAGVAAVAVAAVVLWSGNLTFDTGIGPIDPIESAVPRDFELLMTEESFDMLQDLEFYSWIEIDAEIDVDPGEDADVG